MPRAIASSLLSLLVAATLLWGGCVSCEQYFMFGGPKSCCTPHGQCKTKPPVKSGQGTDCKQIAFEHHQSIDLPIELPVVSRTVVLPAVAPMIAWADTKAVEPSPPDLQVLHSTFLI